MVRGISRDTICVSGEGKRYLLRHNLPLRRCLSGMMLCVIPNSQISSFQSLIPGGRASKQTKACCLTLRSSQRAFLLSHPLKPSLRCGLVGAKAKKPDFALQNQAFVCFGGEGGIRTRGRYH